MTLLGNRRLGLSIGPKGDRGPVGPPAPASSGAGGASTGLAAARPIATGSGKMYFCTDVPAVYVDDPTLVAWQQFGVAGYMPSPGLVADFTVVGPMALSQRGDSILATTTYGTTVGGTVAVALKAIPPALIAAGAWVIDCAGLMAGTYQNVYSEFGLAVTNGTADGVSIAHYVCRYMGPNWGWAAAHTVLNTNSRTNLLPPVNQAPDFMLGAPITHFRLLCDGVTLFLQAGADGAFWRTIVSLAVPVGLTNYGFFVGMDAPGATNGGAGALVQKLRIRALPAQPLISAAVLVGGVGAVITTTTPHDLVLGMPVNITGIVATGTPPNGFYDAGPIAIASPTQFTLAYSAAFTYTSGGKVTNVGLS